MWQCIGEVNKNENGYWKMYTRTHQNHSIYRYPIEVDSIAFARQTKEKEKKIYKNNNGIEEVVDNEYEGIRFMFKQNIELKTISDRVKLYCSSGSISCVCACVLRSMPRCWDEQTILLLANVYAFTHRCVPLIHSIVFHFMGFLALQTSFTFLLRQLTSRRCWKIFCRQSVRQPTVFVSPDFLLTIRLFFFFLIHFIEQTQWNRPIFSRSFLSLECCHHKLFYLHLPTSSFRIGSKTVRRSELSSWCVDSN